MKSLSVRLQSVEVIIIAAENDTRLLGHSTRFLSTLTFVLVRFLSATGCHWHLYVSRC